MTVQNAEPAAKYSVEIFKDGKPFAGPVDIPETTVLILLQGDTPAGAGGLTKRQSECLQFIRNFITANGYSPTMRDIGAGLNLSGTSTAFQAVKQLHKRGYIVKTSERNSIAVTAKGLAVEFK